MWRNSQIVLDRSMLAMEQMEKFHNSTASGLKDSENRFDSDTNVLMVFRVAGYPLITITKIRNEEALDDACVIATKRFDDLAAFRTDQVGGRAKVSIDKSQLVANGF